MQGKRGRCAVPIVARRRGAASERRVCRVGSSSTATLTVKGIIGRNIKKQKRMQTTCRRATSYVMRRCSRTLNRRRTVPFAAYQVNELGIFCLLSPFHPPCLYQFTTFWWQMRCWQVWLWRHIMIVVERMFVEGRVHSFCHSFRK